MKPSLLKKYLPPFPIVLCLAFAGTASADFDPVALTPGSYNADVIVEKTAPRSFPGATTVSMDNGNLNTGSTWYELGFNATAPTSGLPAAGSTFAHASDAAKSYTMPPDYFSNCALFLSNQFTTGTLTLTAPASVTDLSFLSSSGGGQAVINCTITFADATTQAGQITSGDWFNVAGQAFTANGRVTAQTGAVTDVNSGNPRLYSQEISVTSASPVTKVDLTWVSGGRCSIFALTRGVSGTWTPLAVTGFNQDVVVGATEATTAPLTTATSASMDQGLTNGGNTWYERGYYRTTPNSGLPVAGSTITSLALTDHHYTMAANYAAPNAIYVDAANPTATLTLANPLNYSALSFLNAAASGNVTVECTMNYQNGTNEVKQFTCMDWFTNQSYAYTAAGRINLTNRNLNNLGTTNPRLYEQQFVLTNTASPLVSVGMRFVSGTGANSRAVVLAVSATAGALKPVFGTVPSPVNLFSGNSATFTATITGGDPPITFQWQKNTGGTFTNLSNGGNVAGVTTLSLTIDPANAPDQGEYRLVATNTAGSTITQPVMLTVISSLQDVTTPGDPITSFGGTSPANEEVLHAIDNVTQKYLNFGSGPTPNGAPFVGPVGLIVTPSAGPTTVSGVRIYTANDAVGRDPVDFTLEGSNDAGTNWSPIANGPLTLPDGRNAGGAITIDPLTQFLQQVLFSNTVAYTSYRVTFVTVKEPTASNSMQIAEIELLGTKPAGDLIMSDAGDGQYLINTTTPGTLQSSGDFVGPPAWTDLGPISPGAPYLYVPAAGETRKFFRMKP